jgi:hypothetical protein
MGCDLNRSMQYSALTASRGKAAAQARIFDFPELTSAFEVRFQPVNATHWLNRSAGVLMTQWNLT